MWTLFWNWLTGRQSEADILRKLTRCDDKWLKAGLRERRW